MYIEESLIYAELWKKGAMAGLQGIDPKMQQFIQAETERQRFQVKPFNSFQKTLYNRALSVAYIGYPSYCDRR